MGRPGYQTVRRRAFLRQMTAAGGAAALAAFLQSCAASAPEPQETPPAPSPTPAPELQQPAMEANPTMTSTPEKPAPTSTIPAPSATPAETAQGNMARIAFVKTSDRAVGVRRAIDLLGANPVEGKSVFLKPNFNSADPAPGSTHPDILAALVAKLNEMGAQSITVGDRSGMGDTRRVMEQLGVFRLADEMGFNAVVFDEMSAEDWLLTEPDGGHWQRGFAIARPVHDAGALVQACCLKTHRYGGHFTLSLKNSVGMVAKRLPGGDYDFMSELHSSPHQRRMIAEINAAYAPALVVMDGVEAFISGGPDRGEKVSPEVVLAGTDRVALDAVGIALLRYFGCKTEAGRGKIFEQEQIARAVELGLGADGPEKIEFLTADSDSAAYSEDIREVLLAG